MKSLKCNVCSHFHTFCTKLNPLPFYEEVKIPKTVMKILPECFEETLLGELKGASRQFRGPHGSHILEYKKEWKLHRDKIDPRLDPIGHLVSDAPYILVLVSLAIFGLFALTLVVEGGEKR